MEWVPWGDWKPPLSDLNPQYVERTGISSLCYIIAAVDGGIIVNGEIKALGMTYNAACDIMEIWNIWDKKKAFSPCIALHIQFVIKIYWVA